MSFTFVLLHKLVQSARKQLHNIVVNEFVDSTFFFLSEINTKQAPTRNFFLKKQKKQTGHNLHYSKSTNNLWTSNLNPKTNLLKKHHQRLKVRIMSLI